MEPLTRTEAQALAKARYVLLERHQGTAKTADEGRAAEAAELAEHLVFNFINCLSSYHADPMAKEFLHKRFKP